MESYPENPFKMASRRFHPLLCRPLNIPWNYLQNVDQSQGKKHWKRVPKGCWMFGLSTFHLLQNGSLHNFEFTFIWNNIFDDRIWCFRSGLLMYIDFWRNNFFSNLILVWVHTTSRKFGTKIGLLNGINLHYVFYVLKSTQRSIAMYSRSCKWSTKSNISNLSFHILIGTF